jgi:hypothetical protein
MIILGLLILLWPIKTLHIADEDASLVIVPIKNGSTFSIDSIHSVSNSPIVDKFTVTDEGIVLIESIYSDQGGAGMPDVLEDGELLTISENRFIVTRHRVIGNKLNILIDTNSQWAFKMDDHTINNLEDGYVSIEIDYKALINQLVFKQRWQDEN